MLYFKNTVSEQDNRIVYFEALSDDVSVGSCTLVLGEKYAEVTELDFDNKSIFIAEGLLKSAYNYAALKNYYMAKCSVSNIDSLLVRIGFELTDGEYMNDIPTILMGSCNSCSNK